MSCPTCGCHRDHLSDESGKLCAYAPELLAMLRDVLSWTTLDAPYVIVSDARALLTKSEGKQ